MTFLPEKAIKWKIPLKKQKVLEQRQDIWSVGELAQDHIDRALQIIKPASLFHIEINA